MSAANLSTSTCPLPTPTTHCSLPAAEASSFHSALYQLARLAPETEAYFRRTPSLGDAHVQHLLSVCLPVITTFLAEAGVTPRPWDVNPQLSVEVATAAGTGAGVGAGAGSNSSGAMAAGGAAAPQAARAAGFAAASAPSPRIALPVGAAAAAAAASQRTSPTAPAPFGRTMPHGFPIAASQAASAAAAAAASAAGGATAAHRVALGPAARALEDAADPILQDDGEDDEALLAMMDKLDPLPPRPQGGQ